MKIILFFLSNLLRIKYAGLLILVLLPTFLVVNKEAFDWGDDFAQYIYQAQQINTPSDSYKQVLNVDEFSSSKRELFFSVVLSLIEPTNSLSPYLNLISCLYILAAVICFLFFTLEFSIKISFIATLCLFYNFLFLRQKNEVLSEFLFVTLLYTVLHLILIKTTSSNNKLRYVIPILIALLISVRFVGVALFLAYLVDLIILKKYSKKEKIKEAIIFITIVFTLIVGLNLFFLNNVPNREVNLYGSFIFKNISLYTVFENIKTYSRYIFYFFEQEIPFYLNYVISFLVIVFFAIGLFFSIKRSFGIIELTFFAYLICLFVFPYVGDSLRYLIPIVPLFFYYIIKGILCSSNFLVLYLQHQVAVWFLLIVLFSNVNSIWIDYQAKRKRLGPYSSSVLQDFKNVSQYCDSKETIAFSKPFLINLFCDRNSYYLTNTNYAKLIDKADYFLISKQELGYLYFITNEIKTVNADTLSLNHFYLLKLKKAND